MARRVLIKPIISEKAEMLTENHNKYSFIVHRKANKIEIKQAIDKLYSVSVAKVNTIVMPSKQKSRSTKSGVVKGSVSSYKKAIITLAPGEEIDFFTDI